jgi:hypothetical protein
MISWQEKPKRKSTKRKQIKEAGNWIKSKYNFKAKEGNPYGNAKYFMILTYGIVFSSEQIYNTI